MLSLLPIFYGLVLVTKLWMWRSAPALTAAETEETEFLKRFTRKNMKRAFWLFFGGSLAASIIAALLRS